MPGTKKPPIPVYFSHSYRTQDRELNEFFWELFYKQGFHLTVDPKSDTLSVPFLERMMKRSACYAGVVTLRPEQPPYRCSPFIVFEYGLAVQAQKPRLVFVENEIAEAYFPEPEGVCVFNRNNARLQADRGRFQEQIEILADQSRAYRNIGLRPRGKVGFIRQARPETGDPYATVIPSLKQLLRPLGYTPEDLSLEFESNFLFALELDRFDFVVLDVGPSSLPSWVYPFVHGRFTPAIKLLHLPSVSNTDLPPLVSGQLIGGVGSRNDSVLFWSEESELLRLFADQLKKFESTRTEFETLEDGYKYFRSLGRTPANVFLSNSNDANELCAKLSKALNLENINHFHYLYRNSIALGSEWGNKLFEELEKSQIFVALLTKQYWNSEWCKKEYELALERQQKGQMTFIPYFLEAMPGVTAKIQGAALDHLPPHQQVKRIIRDLDEKLI